MSTEERLKEIKELFSGSQISGFRTKDKKKHRLFISERGLLCQYLNRSNRKGIVLELKDVEDFDKYMYVDTEESLKAEYALIDKYRHLAEQNPYTNPWIEKCLKLPNTFERWKKEGRKSLEELEITKPVKKAGEVITMFVLKKNLPKLTEEFLQNYSNDVEYTSDGITHKGRDYCYRVSVNPKDGTVMGQVVITEENIGQKVFNMINSDKFIIYSNTI